MTDYPRLLVYKASAGSGKTYTAIALAVRALKNKEIKKIIDDKSKYTDYLVREDIKANLQFDLAVILDEYGYPPVTIDDVYKEVLEQAENFKKYAE